LLNSLAYNLNRKNFDAWLFETGSVFWREAGKPICEERRLGAVFSGNAEAPSWLSAGRALGLFDVRGLLTEMSQRLRLPEFQFSPLQNHLFYKSGWQINCNGEALGSAGELAVDLLELYEIEAPTFAFELSLENFPALIDWQRIAKAVPRFPAIERDIAIITARNIPAEKVMAAIKIAAGEFLESVRLFDLYTGKPIPEDKKSLAFALFFRAADRNLRDEEVDAWQSQIVRHLEKEVGAQLRA
jgi:phenylalanyl-tRNA synthetase beta chain